MSERTARKRKAVSYAMDDEEGGDAGSDGISIDKGFFKQTS